MKALAIAATGMSAQQTNLEVIANNVANINTTGFKRARAEFADLLYQVDRRQGVPNRNGELPIPEGARVGLGVAAALEPHQFDGQAGLVEAAHGEAASVLVEGHRTVAGDPAHRVLVRLRVGGLLQQLDGSEAGQLLW